MKAILVLRFGVIKTLGHDLWDFMRLKSISSVSLLPTLIRLHP